MLSNRGVIHVCGSSHHGCLITVNFDLAACCIMIAVQPHAGDMRVTFAMVCALATLVIDEVTQVLRLTAVS